MHLSHPTLAALSTLRLRKEGEWEKERGKVRFDLHTPEHQFPCIFNEGSRPPSGHTYRRCTGAGIRGQTRISHGLLVPPRTAARLRIEVAIHTVESPPRIVRESGSDFSHQACYIPFPSLSKGGEVRIFSPFSPPPPKGRGGIEISMQEMASRPLFFTYSSGGGGGKGKKKSET